MSAVSEMCVFQAGVCLLILVLNEVRYDWAVVIFARLWHNLKPSCYQMYQLEPSSCLIGTRFESQVGCRYT
jgi:hypothetical protein